MDRLHSGSYVIRTVPEFDAWLRSLRSITVRQRLLTRLRKASRGTLGDIKALGGGILEMREHFGPGWRMYLIRCNKDTLVMLAGGTKGSQRRDIELAGQLARTITGHDSETTQTRKGC